MNKEQLDHVINHVIAELNNGTSERTIRQELYDKGYPAHFTERVFDEIYAVTTATSEHAKESMTDVLIGILERRAAKTRRTQGRIGRIGFLATFVIAHAMIALPVLALAVFLRARGDTLSSSTEVGIVVLVILLMGTSIWMIWFRIALCARRLHDMNQSGYWAFLSLLGIVDIIFYIVLASISGTPDVNRYGRPNSTRNPLRIFTNKQ